MISFEIPIKTKNPLNGGQWNWRAKAGRRAKEREAVTLIAGKKIVKGRIPCAVRLVRKYSGKAMDSDGVGPALKSVRDQLAQLIGINDGDSRCSWLYDQVKAKRADFGVIVTMTYVD